MSSFHKNVEQNFSLLNKYEGILVLDCVQWISQYVQAVNYDIEDTDIFYSFDENISSVFIVRTFSY